MAVDQVKQVVYTFEFKRTSDREHGYVQGCDERATEQYAGLLQIIKRIVMSKGWNVQAVNFWDEVHESRSMEQGDGNDRGSEA